MPISPERLAAMLASAKVKAAAEVQDPTASNNSAAAPVPKLDTPKELFTNISSGSSTPTATVDHSEEAALSSDLGITDTDLQGITHLVPSPGVPPIFSSLTNTTQAAIQQPSVTALKNSADLSTLPLQSPTSVDVSYPGMYELHEKIIALDKALQANHPQFDSLLQVIHRNLSKDAQLLHMLKEEQIAVVFRALKKQTQTVIVDETVRSATRGGGKSLKNIGMGDL